MTEGCCRLPPCQVALVTVSTVILALAAASYPVIEYIVKQQVRQKVVLKNGSETYAMWKEPTIPIYLQIYVFDLQNAEDVVDGSKPRVVERGPYTYREHRKKVDVVHQENGTVTYRQIKTYHFIRNLSIGSDDEVFTTANLPIITLAHSARWGGFGQYLMAHWAKYVKDVDGGLFIKKSVRDVVFGYKDPLLTMGMIFYPGRFYTNLVGILAGKNATDDGVYTVYTGEQKLDQVGEIDKYNGTSHLDFWTSRTANMINGTDGTLAPPFITKDTTVYMFSSDICRSVSGRYKKDVSSPHGVPLYRFSATKSSVASADENPDNAGFCTPAGDCMRAGVVNLTNCQMLDSFHVPMIASFPHFYLGDQAYVDAITGLHPDPTQHATNIDIEPTTGLVMQISKRLQLNVHVENVTDIEILKNIRSMVYPILWLNESAVVDPAHENQVKKELLLPMKITTIAQYVGFGVGGALMIVFLALLLYGRRQQSVLLVNEPTGERSDDTDKLLT